MDLGVGLDVGQARGPLPVDQRGAERVGPVNYVLAGFYSPAGIAPEAQFGFDKSDGKKKRREGRTKHVR